MNRSELRPCYCKSPCPPNPSSRYTGVREDPGGVENTAYYPDVGRRNPQYGGGQVNDGNAPIDPQTLNTISSLRKKACQFLRSESESSSSAPGHQCRNVNHYMGSNVLRQANDMIDYVPQSEFLRKMKQQCQYLQNDQPNIFSTLDNCEQYSSQECQRCIERAKMVLSVGDQIKCSRYRSPPPEGPHQNLPCNDEFGIMNNFEGGQMYPRDPQYFYQTNGMNDCQRLPRDTRMLPKGNLERINEEVSEKILEKPTRYREKSETGGKKSEHVSRSKKPAKCRSRRKRKSDSSDKCESGEELEPNLKKPHENSCERCWRYASPSRSPVNKPDQRYDPNFRRGHSCMDFNGEMGDGDLEVSGKRISPCKNLQPITSREKVPVSSQTQSTRQQPEVIQQKTHLSPRKTQFSSQEGPPLTASQCRPQAAQCSPQKTQYIQQHPQDQIKHNTSFTKVKELMYNYSQSKSPEKNAPQSQPCEGRRKSPTSPKILQTETGRKPRPKSFTAGAPVSDPENLPPYLLNVTDYCDLCLKPKQGLDQNEANKRSVRLNGNKPEHPVGENKYPRPATAGSPLKAATPQKSNRQEPSPKASSTPKKSSKSKTPDQCNTVPNAPNAPRPKENSPKPKSPKTPTNVNLNKPVTPDSDATVYAEVIVKTYDNPCTPKKSEGQSQQSSKKFPSPKTKPKSGNSPKKGSKNGSPRKVQSSADLIENLSPIGEGRPQTGFVLPTEHDIYPGFRGMNDPYTGIHPIRDCWCPPRAPFIKGNTCNNPDPDQIFCCHCNWEENRKNEEQRVRIPPSPQSNVARNERPKPQANEVGERQFVNERKYGAPAPRHENMPSENIFLESVYPQVEDHRMECPYRAFQRERRAANDTSWEADYQRLKEFCFKHPGELHYQVTTKTENPFKNSEYLPTKYALFYMTENKKDKGDDVEVLVEELTQACPKNSDSRTKDITDKMKRIMECPSDSMALRFQKGVSESCKTPHSSRILYF